MNSLKSRAAAALALATAGLSAHAAQVEFNVPVELRNIDPAATHVVVTCGSFGDNRFLNSERSEVALQNAGTHKQYSGTVKVVVAWPGATVPTGSYKCSMAMKGPNLFADFSSRPAATRTTVVTEVTGSFSELNLQQSAHTKSTANLAVVKQTKPAKAEILK